MSVCVMLIFSSCTKKPAQTALVDGNETKNTEAGSEDTTDNDRDYLISLASQLMSGMDMDEVFFRLGEPDIGKNTSSLLNVIYNRGDYSLCVSGPIVNGAFVTNNKTGEETVVKLSKPQKDGSDSYEEADVIDLGKRIKPDMTERDVMDKLGEPDERLGAELVWLKYHYGDYTLYVDIWSAKDKVYRVRVFNYESNENTQIYVSDEPIIAE